MATFIEQIRTILTVLGEGAVEMDEELKTKPGRSLASHYNLQMPRPPTIPGGGELRSPHPDQRTYG